MGKIQYSKKAIEQLSQGQQSYALTGVRFGWTWFLLSSVTLFIIGLLAWGFYGSMVERVNGIGIVLPRGGLHPIIAGANGKLLHLNIKPGSVVYSDQIIGQILNPEMFFNVRKLDSEYALLLSEVNFLKEGTERLTAQKVAMEKERKSMLDMLRNHQEASKKRAEEVANIYSKMKQEGAASKLNHYQALDQMLQTESSMINTLFMSMESSISLQDRLWEKEQRLVDLNQRSEQKRKDLELAEKLYKEQYWVTPGVNGKVIEVLKSEGSFLHQGDNIALVAVDDDDGLYVTAFVAASEGKKISTGMSAFFSPSSASAAENGYVKAVVRNVSEAPVDIESIQAELMNTSLTRMTAEKTAMFRIVLELIPEPNKSLATYRWTSKKGESRHIVNGMIGEVIINTSYRSPASYVIPAVRAFLNRRNNNQG